MIAARISQLTRFLIAFAIRNTQYKKCKYIPLRNSEENKIGKICHNIGVEGLNKEDLIHGVKNPDREYVELEPQSIMF